MKYYLAVDIGASSGRHIVGWREGRQIRTREVYRFPNGVRRENGHLCWDPEALLREVKIGIREAFSRFGHLESLSVDTWGVDYVLLDSSDQIIHSYAYRDPRTEAVIPLVHEKIPFAVLYSRTGCQFQPFNTVYQRCDDLQNGDLDRAAALLMMPEYLLYGLTGVKVREYTNATTTGLVNARTGEYDGEILRKLGLPGRLFPPLTRPGRVLDGLLPTVAAEVGGSCRVVLCATHDTASAVEGIPMEENAPYISSGTWSLLGVRTPAPITGEESRAANYSNEGGVGCNRYQKNIMGMWLINRLKAELCPELSFPEIMKAARESACPALVDANDPRFLAPDSMKAAFDAAASGALSGVGDYFRCACRSLAVSYRDALEELERNTGKNYGTLYIVGGGAKNTFLNELTEEMTGKKVIALPIEATALGNLTIQMEVRNQ